MSAGVAASSRLLVLTGFPAIGGPLPKLAPSMVDGFRAGGFEVAVEGWSAHTAGRESLSTKLMGRSRDLLQVQRRIRTWRPDVVYVATAHNWPGLLRDLPLALSVRRRRPPLVVHFHGSESHRLVAPGSEALKRASALLVGRTDAVLLLSHEEKRQWEAFCPGPRYEVVVNPFAPVAGRAEPAPAGDEPALLFVARLIPEKGALDLLDAFALLRRRRPCRLLIAGTGPARDDIVRRAGLLGVADSVVLLGYVGGAELDAAYRAASAFVLPTYFPEGFPLAVMEAMGYALPIVTTRIRGCADHLQEGRHALFVPAHDPESLATTLERLLSDETLRLAIGRANVEKVAEFAPAEVIPPYVEILRGAMIGVGS